MDEKAFVWLNSRLNGLAGVNRISAIRAFLTIEKIVRANGDNRLADFIRGVAYLTVVKRRSRSPPSNPLGRRQRTLEADIKRAIKGQEILQWVEAQKADPRVANPSILGKAAAKFGLTEREVQRYLAEARSAIGKTVIPIC